MTGSKWVSACLAVMFCAVGVSYAQGYPNQPVRVIFPFAAGGAGDIIARAYGQKFTGNFGQGRGKTAGEAGIRL